MYEAGLMEVRFGIRSQEMGAAQRAAQRIASLGHLLGSPSEYDWVDGAKPKVVSRCYAGVDSDALAAAATLQETFEVWGWELELDEGGNVCGLDGPSCGKVLDDKVLFDAVAPFVEDGSHIQMISDADNSIWRWIFRNGRCDEVEATLVFE